ncbi:YcjX family protein [Defluviimonas sp. WL0002]|uniref:YcjX family protein n=1 Tax=Albidovulum marisflavi TaxID=2984159 RepID=A0ABT2ZA25_9RHOB|nr:YcjX family protein [Defluviimonas sp. WL0002]MCV2867933.1 YcjX family protein [Defluviimonas sp. WL0002]
MSIGDFVDDLTARAEALGQGLTGGFGTRTVRLGVTGLSRAGKTVFITQLVANLLERGRMSGLRAVAEGRILAAFLQPQPDDTVPRFDYETHLAALTGPDPHWPESTRAVSELRLSLRVAPSGLLAGLGGERRVNIDIVDYPGEWLLDLGLMDMDFGRWSREVMTRIAARAEAAGYLKALQAIDPAAPFDEVQAKSLSGHYDSYLKAARAAGYSDCGPGRFLLPGELEGSPVLTFAPLPRTEAAPRGSVWHEMARRYEAYKSKVVRPFFRDHFARIDRQVVLVDVLGAIHSGPRAVEDLRGAMEAVLGAFRPGRPGWLAGLLGGRRVERILFAATKADHLHHSQHARLTRFLAALLRSARDRADFAGADTAAMAIAALRATVEESHERGGEVVDCVRGRLLAGGREAALFPGELPESPAAMLAEAHGGAEHWLDADYAVMAFAPARLSLRPGDGPPHIRLDRAAEFLIGDLL